MYHPPSILWRFSNFLIPSAFIPQKHEVETWYDETGREGSPCVSLQFNTPQIGGAYTHTSTFNIGVSTRACPSFSPSEKATSLPDAFSKLEADRPAINFNDKPRVAFMFGRTTGVLGSVVVTLRFHDIAKYGTFKINVRAYVVEDLEVPLYVCPGD